MDRASRDGVSRRPAAVVAIVGGHYNPLVLGRLLARFRPRIERHLFLARDLSDPVGDADPGALTAWVEPSEQSQLPMLKEFCGLAGFPEGWPAEMLQLGARAVMAIQPGVGLPLAMAWLTDRPFQVEEVGVTFDPSGGAYLFGDYVLTSFRGKGLQRLLVNRRLACAKGLAAAIAHTIIHPGNIASLKSYRSEGFIASATYIHRRWLGRSSRSCATDPASAVRLALGDDGVIRLVS